MSISSIRKRGIIVAGVVALAGCGAEDAQSAADQQSSSTTANTTDAEAEPDKPSYANMRAGVYSIDPNHTSIVWKVSHLGLSQYTARFLDIDGTLKFDPESPTESVIEITIDPASVHTGFPDPDTEDFDHDLGYEEIWFNANEFPEIKFSSTAIDIGDGSKGTVTGELEFLGVTKPITLDVTFNGAIPEKPRTRESALGFSATGSIKRSDWGLDTYVGPIGDAVDLLIEAEFEMPAADVVEGGEEG